MDRQTDLFAVDRCADRLTPGIKPRAALGGFALSLVQVGVFEGRGGLAGHSLKPLAVGFADRLRWIAA